jgi:hypothetical protein
MPQKSDIHAVIETILRDDAEPLDEDYSPVEFAATLARSLSSDHVRELTSAAIRQLPACLADSILEGISSVAMNALDPQLLYDTIPSGRQVDSAGTVVQFIVSKFSLPADDVAAELFRRLHLASESEAQDRYSFAIWMLYCGEMLLIAENKVVGHLVSPAEEEIGRQLLRGDLSKYARETLRACQAASHRGDPAGA